jgi:hypothetical protein
MEAFHVEWTSRQSRMEDYYTVYRKQCVYVMEVVTVLFDVLPDNEPIRFETYRSFTVLI